MSLDYDIDHDRGEVTIWVHDGVGVEVDETDLLHLLAELRGDRDPGQVVAQ